MISPMPVDELPSFIEKNKDIEPLVNDPWLKYIIVGGVLILAVVISAAIIGKHQQNRNTKTIEENEY